MRWVSAAAIATLGLGCGSGTHQGARGSGGAGTGAASSAGGATGAWVPPPRVVVPKLPPPPDYSHNPKDANGLPILAVGPDVYLTTPAAPDALTARQLCADLVGNCFLPGTRSLDACMLSAPRCTTSQPWKESTPCCAEACWTAYAALRMTAVDPLTAYLGVLYDAPICMPGADALLGGGP